MTNKDKPTVVLDTDEPIGGFGPRESILGLDDEDGLEIDIDDENDHDEYLYDYAMEYLPRLPQLDAILEQVSLDYSVLVSAHILAEELADMDDAALDDLLSALLLAGEGDEELQAELYANLSPGAQQAVMALQDIMNAENHTDITDAPAAARTLMLAGALADIEVIDELIEEDEGETLEFEEMQITGQIMAALSEKGGITAALLERAVTSFNLVATKTQTPLTLRLAGEALQLDESRPPSSDRKPPRP